MLRKNSGMVENIQKYGTVKNANIKNTKKREHSISQKKSEILKMLHLGDFSRTMDW